MLADKAERAPNNLTWIRLDDESEVRFWCVNFSVTPDELRACVLEVGPRAEDVEKQLRKAGRKSFSMGGED